jgi:hypothetical protein
MSTPLAIGAIAALAAVSLFSKRRRAGSQALTSKLSKRGSRSFFPTEMPEGMAEGLFMWEPVMTEVLSVAPLEYGGYTRRTFEPNSFLLPAQDGQPDRDVWIDRGGDTFVWSEERGKEYVTCEVEWEDLGPGEGPAVSSSDIAYEFEHLTSTGSEYKEDVWWDSQASPSGPTVFADSDFNTYRYNRFKGWVPHRYAMKPVVRLR